MGFFGLFNNPAKGGTVEGLLLDISGDGVLRIDALDFFRLRNTAYNNSRDIFVRAVSSN
jgi:hypothetical protein